MSECAPQPESVSTSQLGADVENALAVLLRGRDVACPHCGHNMRDGHPRRCSECGKFVVPTLSLSQAVLAQRNPRLVGRDWLFRCFAFAPATAHLCFFLTLGLACLMTSRSGYPPAVGAQTLLIFHFVAGSVLGVLAYLFTRLRKTGSATTRFIGLTSGVLLAALGLLSAIATSLFKDWGFM